MSFTALTINNKEYKLRCNHKSLLAIKEHFGLNSLTDVHNKIAELLQSVELNYLLLSFLQTHHFDDFKQLNDVEKLFGDDMEAGEYLKLQTEIANAISREFMRSLGLSDEQIQEATKEVSRQKKASTFKTA